MGKQTGHRWFALVWGTCLALASQAAAATSLADLRAQFAQPEERVDFAAAKLVIDQMIDPDTDIDLVRRELDALANAVRRITPEGASNRAKLDALLTTLYRPGPWNGDRPFQYDLADPLGTNRKNKLLATYLATRKGNCVSMPVLVATLGQHLGLRVTLATAPEHVLVKFADDNGEWLNVEATAGGFKYDSSYEKETGITPAAVKSEIYLRPLSPRESVGVMASTLMEHYAAQKRGDELLAIADMALATNPKDVVAMVQKANAYYFQLQQRFVKRYRTPADIPKDQVPEYVRLSRENLAWVANAERLGWTPPAPEKDATYLQSIEREKARRGM